MPTLLNIPGINPATSILPNANSLQKYFAYWCHDLSHLTSLTKCFKLWDL